MQLKNFSGKGLGNRLLPNRNLWIKEAKPPTFHFAVGVRIKGWFHVEWQPGGSLSLRTPESPERGAPPAQFMNLFQVGSKLGVKHELTLLV